MSKLELPRRARAAWLCAGLLAAVAVPCAAQAKTVLVIASHPDDEVLLGAGRARTALTAGDTIKVVVSANGDSDGTAVAPGRMNNTVVSMLALGLTEQDVIFLGYGDGTLHSLFSAFSPTTVITSQAGMTETYGARGLGGMEWHRYRAGAHGPYNRQTLLGDYMSLIQQYLPDEIYTHSDWEDHSDHQGVALFVAEALRTLVRQGVPLRTKLYQTVVWMPGTRPLGDLPTTWPSISPTGFTPRVPFLPASSSCVPGTCLDATPVDWSRAVHFAQPPEMVDTDVTRNLKAVASPFKDPWYVSFARLDEFFWVKDFGTNVAVTAAATASAQEYDHPASAAIDGIMKGAPNELGLEWTTIGQLAGAWLQLDWAAPQRIAQVNLWDRPSLTENVLASHLTFSDGSTIDVGALAANGHVSVITFAPKTVSWVRFTVDAAEGTAAGLSELQVFGQPASSSANLAPHFLWGPLPATTTIPASSTALVAALAHDLDGDPVQYTWSTESGLVQPNGSTATFSPAPVTTATWVAITAQATDGRGGSAVNRTYVQVTPAPVDGVLLSPALLFGGDVVTGTLVLAAPAGGAGVEVALSSDHPSVSVPASVTVPAGASSATFPVTTSIVAAKTSAIVRATFASGVRGSSVTLVPRSVTSVALSPAAVLGGGTVTARVTLPAPAGASGAVVSLASSASALATVPATVTVPAGSTSATFSVVTSPVAVATAVTISATFGTTASAVLTVADPATAPVNPNLLTNGEGIGGAGWENLGPALVVTLGAATAPDGSQNATRAVNATSDFPAIRQGVAVSPGVTYTFSFFARNNGGTGAAYSIYDLWNGFNVVPPTSYVASLAGSTWKRISVTFTAPAGTSYVGVFPLRDTSTPVDLLLWGAKLEVGTVATGYANLGGTLAVAPASVVSGEVATGTVTLPAPAPAGGATVALASSSSAASVPASVQVAAGATQATFAVTAGTVQAATSVTITASLPGGATCTAALTVLPGAGVTGVTVSPAIVVGGGTVQGTVSLGSPAGQKGAAVTVSATGSGVSFSTTVTVPAGATSAPFSWKTPGVWWPVQVTVTAKLGSSSASTTLTIVPSPVVTGVSVAPANVTGGTAATGTVTLTGMAPAGGFTVALYDTSGAASVPASVVVPAGATSATFTIATTPVAWQTWVGVAASGGGAVATTSFNVVPPAAKALSIAPTSVVSGKPATATLTLNGPAPAGGLVAALWTNSGYASVPASVVVAAGATTATFQVTTGLVAWSTTATVSAYCGGTVSADLAIAPITIASVKVSPTTVRGGTSATGTVTLTGPTPTAASVVLWTNDGTVVVPSTVTVPAGASSATFAIKTSTPWTTIPVTVTALFGTTATATLTVTR